MKKLFFSLLLTIFLVGCTSIKPYVLPENSSFAYIKNEVSAASHRHSSTDISVKNLHSKEFSRLFLVSKRSSYSKNKDPFPTNPPGPHKVEANTPIIIQFHEAIPDRYCIVSIKGILQPGKTYVLTGGGFFEEGPIFFLPGPYKCKLALEEEEQRQRLQLIQRELKELQKKIQEEQEASNNPSVEQ